MKLKQTFTVMAFVTAILGSQTIKAQSWNLTGNSNATVKSKLGTTNAKPLALTTNNKTRIYIDATVGNVGIGSNNFSNPNYRLYVGSNILDSSSGAIWGDGSQYGVTGTGIYGVYGAGDYGLYGNGNIYGVWGNGSHTYGVYGVSNTNFGTSGISGYLGVYGQGGSIGVYGISSGGNGVYGQSDNSNGGYFYSTNSYGLRAATANGSYAGVFDGKVYSFGGYFSASDKNLKQNIQDFGDAMSIINKLKPKNYEFRTDDAKFASFNLPKGTHYGLIAQDVEQVLPNLVKESPQEIGRKEDKPKALQFNSKGEAIPSATEQKINPEQAKKETMNIKGVNYEELIPILIKGMQEQDKVIHDQDAKIEALTQLVNKLQGASSVSLGAQSSVAVKLTSATLDQNVPNPLTNSTSISYSLPLGVSKALITVTDNNGNTIKQIPLNGSGKGAVNIEASTLSAGTYSYTLTVDGKPVETKRMVVVR